MHLAMMVYTQNNPITPSLYVQKAKRTAAKPKHILCSEIFTFSTDLLRIAYTIF